MTDITKIPHTELMKDKHESLADINVCRAALGMGVATYGNGKSTQKRLDTNKRIVKKIDAERARRETDDAPV